MIHMFIEIWNIKFVFALHPNKYKSKGSSPLLPTTIAMYMRVDEYSKEILGICT